MRKAFTLMEVNLAILIMAGGILSILGLYSLGYRENRQSREDVASAAYADAVMSPLIMALSSTNLKWSSFIEIQNMPSREGWKDYIDESSGIVKDNPDSKAEQVFSHIKDCIGSDVFDVKLEWPSKELVGKMRAGLVILRDSSQSKEGAIVRIAFRATKNPAELLAMPMYYAEVRFQGVVDKE